MNRKEIIEIIRYFYEVDFMDMNNDLNSVHIALINCDYYVRPGEKRDNFMNEFYDTMKRECAPETTLELFCWQVRAIKLIRKYFDVEYFQSKIEMDSDNTSKTLLKTYLELFNRNQLREFVGFVINGRLKCDLFISNYSSNELWKKLNDMCKERDNAVPGIWEPGHSALVAKNPLYHLDYLNEKTVANTFCEHIDKDIELASQAAKVYYERGVEAAYNYVKNELLRPA